MINTAFDMNIEQHIIMKHIYIYIYILNVTTYFISDSILSSQREATESEIGSAISSHLKYAPDRRGGCGRQKSSQD